MRVFTTISLAAVLFVSTLGQSTATKASFESADVHVSPHRVNTAMRSASLRSGRYEWKSALNRDIAIKVSAERFGRAAARLSPFARGQ